MQSLRKVTGSDAGTQECTVRYYALSRSLSAEHASRVIRQHWGIENQVHWVLDVIFDEDRSRSRKDHAPKNLSLVRKLVLNVLGLDDSKGSLKGKLHRAGWNEDFLEEIMIKFASI